MHHKYSNHNRIPLIGKVYLALSMLVFILLPHLLPLPFYSYSIVCFLLLLFFLKLQSSSLKQLGIDRKKFSMNAVLVGLIAAVLLDRLMAWVYYPVIHNFFGYDSASYKEYNFLKGNTPLYLQTIIASWIVAGFYEEIIFRGYILCSVRKLLNNPSDYWLRAVISSVLFGLYHWQQGYFGVIHAFLAGLFWAVLLKKYKGNLWYTIMSHAFYDTIVLTFIYLGKFGK